jgi:multidrug efflux pump subunit AcrA (membrane-fusion protein)
VRTEGALDPRERMLHVIAEIPEPYASGGDGCPPLAVGLFVEAEIEGRMLPGVVVLPRSALRGGDRVLVVDGEARLHWREVEVLRRDRDEVFLGAGLEPGELVCVSPVEIAVEGMKVRVER